MSQTRQQPAWRQNSVPSYTQTPVHQPTGAEVQYKMSYPQGTPVYQDQYNNNNNGYEPMPQQATQPQSQAYSAPAYLAKPKPAAIAPTTVSFSGGMPVNKPVPKPNTDYYWTQQQHFYNNDDDKTINQGRGGSLQRNQQTETMQSRPQYNSQSSLPRAGYGQQDNGYGAPQQQQQQPTRWAAAPQHQQQQQQPQPVYNSYQNNNNYNAPSYVSAPQYPATVSYQSTAYNQV